MSAAAGPAPAARRRRALAVVVAPVLAIHAAALLLSAGAAGQPARGGPAPAGLPVIRLVTMASTLPAPAAAADQPSPKRERVSKRPPADGAPADPPAAQRAGPAPAPAGPDPAAVAAAPPPSTGELGGAAVEAGAPPEYLPRERLSVAPRPLASIDIPFPPEVAGTVNLATELSLFIDETGTVRRVRVDGAALPPALEDAARSSFLAARFAPGELDGAPVRALIRVAVSFETDALPLAAAAMR